MKILRRLTFALLFVSACRIGGPSGDPSAYVVFTDAAADAPDETPAMAETGDDDAATTGVDSADDSSDSSIVSDAARDAPSVDGADGGDAAVACVPVTTIPVCNPLTNAGCFLVQCDIDTSQTTPTGICVLAAPMLAAEGASCTQTAGSVSCQPKLTCSGGTCRKVCFCDSDCTSGECCVTSYSTTGFKLCGACH